MTLLTCSAIRPSNGWFFQGTVPGNVKRPPQSLVRLKQLNAAAHSAANDEVVEGSTRPRPGNTRGPVKINTWGEHMLGFEFFQVDE